MGNKAKAKPYDRSSETNVLYEHIKVVDEEELIVGNSGVIVGGVDGGFTAGNVIGGVVEAVSCDGRRMIFCVFQRKLYVFLAPS